jgi:FtsH-binding integral membrane protein
MNSIDSVNTRVADARNASTVGPAPVVGVRAVAGNVQRVLRNTYALLSMTLLFSAGVAAAGAAWPASTTSR